ncbi:MAG: pirin family protein [Pseudomonadota bacterium]
MTTIRRADQRGLANFGWLQSRHTFSFGHYFDPQHMGFGPLRVINEDRVQAGRGFGGHGHRDMEIISYVVEGALEHRDSLGNGSVIRPGDVQRMSAGTGVRHSEMNHSAADPVHFLQIWIEPERNGITPSYEQTHFAVAERQGVLKLVGSRDGRDGSVTIHRDLDLYASVLAQGDRIDHELLPGRQLWLQVVRGELELAGMVMSAGDGVALVSVGGIAVKADTEAELLLFDMAV